MFDPFSATVGQIDEISKHFSIQVYAIAQLLLAKGLVTEDEYKQAINMATAQIDQMWEDRRQQQLRDNPSLATLQKLFGNVLG